MRPRGRLPGRRFVLASVDALVAVATFVFSVWLRRTVRFPGTLGRIPVENVPLDPFPWLAGVAAVALVSLAIVETWEEPTQAVRDRGGFLVASLLTGTLLLVLFFLAGRAVPRTVLPVFVPLLALALSAWRRVADLLVPISPRGVFVVGEGTDADEAAGALSRGEVVGHFLGGRALDPRSLVIEGSGLHLPSGPRDVVFAPREGTDRALLVALVEKSLGERFDLWLLPGVLDAVASRPATRRLGDLPLVLVAARGVSLPARLLRRSVDLLLGAPLAVLSLPLLALASAVVALESPGPPWYRQKRVGQGGTGFDVWKLRTMRAGAEEETGPVLSGPGDRRVTRIGTFFRRTRLDELPQLLLVVRGSMSLIGPRPERPEFAARYERDIPAYRLRYLLKPGLTGLAQVMGAYATRTDVKLRYDLGYLFHWSPLLDLFVLARTVTTVLRGSGT